MNPSLLPFYGLKWNPFSPDLPVEALYVSAPVENFCWRIEQQLISDGGFAMISGDPGSGKSAVLRLLAYRLDEARDISVGAITHPSGNIADFYRELGDLFNVPLRPHNRWGGFKALRERWQAHMQNTTTRPVLLIDEAQEMPPNVLNELRLLSSTDYDSRTLLSVILAGDARLQHKLRRDELLPLGSRMRVRLAMHYAERDELLACLKHLLQTAGNTALMSEALVENLCDHAAGNYRVLSTMAAQLLAAAAKEELKQLDEALYLRVFEPPRTQTGKRA